MLANEYYKKVLEIIKRIFEEERESINSAAEVIAKATMEDKIIHAFGTGHSMIIAEELFLRAGGLININAILDKELSIMKGVVSSLNEKTPGFAEKVLRKYNLSPGDVFIIASVSGVNAVPVEAAYIAKQKGLTVIALTSVEASSKLPTRNPLNKHLYEVADIVIDTKVPYGDAILPLPNTEARAVPISTIAGVFAAELIIAEAIDKMLKKGFTPPIWVSGNVPDSDKINMKYLDKLIGRITHLNVEEMMLRLKAMEEKESSKIGKAEEIDSIMLKGIVITPFRRIENGVVVIKGGRIVYVGDDEKKIPEAKIKLIFEEDYIIPGLIDVHVHGCEGAMAFDGDPNSLKKMAYNLAKHGVTGFLPTGITLPHDSILKIAEAVKEASKEIVGAKILGMNSEGPFVNPEKKGALITGFMRPANADELKEIYEASGGLLKIVTIAPEIENAMEAIRWMSLNGVIPSIGHSNADYDTAMNAFENGARHITHLYNAMREFRHRDPGIIGAAFERDDVTVELIADGIHVYPSAIKVAITNKGWKNIILISDATPLAGVPDGEYKFPGFPTITVKNGKATLPDGTLAGSTLTLERALKFLTSIGVPLERAIQMGSTNPARLLGLNKGIIKVGFDGDITVLDKNFRVKLTVVEGKIVYRA